ncbi:MAG: response regulator [Pseudomonadota bacterium]
MDLSELAPAASAAEQMPRILVVDDEALVRTELVELFEDDDLEALAAPSAAAAIAAVESDPGIGIVFTDVRMPGMNGIELAARLRDLSTPARPLAVVIITGHGGMEDAVAALNHGAVDFVTKPFDYARTHEALDRAIHLWRRETLTFQSAHRLESRVEQQVHAIDALQQSLIDRNIQLEAENRTKELFLRSICHELKTPLLHLQGSMEIIGEMLPEDSASELSGWVDLAQDTMGQVGNHVSAILELSNVDPQGAELHRVRFDPARVCETVAALYRNKAELRSQELTVYARAGKSQVYADRGRLQVAVGHIIDNAVRHCPDFAKIGVHLGFDSAWPDHIQISITDDGPGISADVVEQALSPHRALAAGLYEDHVTLPLGLYLARRNMQLNGGELSVERLPSRGSQVSLHLPLEGLLPAAAPRADAGATKPAAVRPMAS